MKIAILQTRLSASNTFLMPLGMLYVAAYLRQQGHEVIAIDDDPEVNDPIPAMLEFRPALVGLTLMTPYYRKADAIVRRIRKHLPGTVICAGGIHPSALPERTVRELGGGLDFVVVGEGELTLAKVASAMEAGGKDIAIPGTVYNRDGRIVNNGRAPVCEDLDILPFPARDLLDIEKYMTPPGPIKGIPLSRTTNLISSRGCPAACIYCGNQVLFDRRVRRRSVDNVISELEELVTKYEIKGFNFVDDTFMLNHNHWVDEFCHKLIDKRWNLKWVCSTRANLVTDELVPLMYEAGCRQYEIGVESGSDRILRLMKKGLTTEQIARGYEIARRNGMRRMASFMIGFPTETEEDIRMTGQFAKKIKPDFASFFFLTPYPGTELYQMALNEGWVPKDHEFGEEWTIRQSETPLMAVEFTPEQLKKFRAKLQNAFFFRNYVSSMNIPFTALMIWALLSSPRLFFEAIKLLLRTKRFDYLAESALKAYRYKVEKKR